METIVRKKRKPMGEINVVPFIDVMLVLLVVFMVTAPLLNQGIEVELPEANNEPLAIDENQETLVVSLTAEGEQVGIITAANPTIQVLVEGDTQAGWGAMVNLITTLQAAGVVNPNFITQPLGVQQ